MLCLRSFTDHRYMVSFLFSYTARPDSLTGHHNSHRPSQDLNAISASYASKTPHSACCTLSRSVSSKGSTHSRCGASSDTRSETIATCVANIEHCRGRNSFLPGFLADLNHRTSWPIFSCTRTRMPCIMGVNMIIHGGTPKWASTSNRGVRSEDR